MQGLNRNKFLIGALTMRYRPKGLVQIMCSYTTIGLNIGTGRLLQVIGCNWYEATCGFLKVSCKE